MTQQIPTITEKSNPPALAKLTPPSLDAVYVRTRLFRLLDSARKRPIIWVSAPGGAGKTTLIASYLQARRLPVLWYQIDAGDSDVGSLFYHMSLAANAADSLNREPLPTLTAEYHTDLNAFTTNFFRDFFARFDRRHVVVLDNFQDAKGEAIQQTLRQALEQIPAGITVIVISREDPPGTLARARASERIALLRWNDLKLTEEESDAIAASRVAQQPSRAQLNALYRQTQGWIAGLVLLTESIDRTLEALPLNGDPDQSIFDYFASEVFDHANDDLKTFLLRTAFLPKISGTAALRLANCSNGEAILQDLQRRNFFTVKHADGSFEYHPLFRAFLLNRIRTTCARTEIDVLKRRSAEILAEADNVEMAVNLLLDAKDWRPCLDLVLKHARVLYTQGRTRTLESWLINFPREFYDLNPWVSYWLGMCRLPFRPKDARVDFERAFSMFEKGTDASPLFLTWCRIIDTFTFELDDYGAMEKWLDRYHTLQQGYSPLSSRIENASVFTYIVGRINCDFGHPDLESFVKRAEILLENEADKDREVPRLAALIPYYLWRGDWERMRRLLSRFTAHAANSSAHVVARMFGYMWTSICESTAGAPEKALKATHDGLNLAVSSGIHVTDIQLYTYGIWGQLSVGHRDIARDLFDKLSALPRSGRVNESIYLHHAGMVSLHEGNIDRAIEEAKRATDLARVIKSSIGAISYAIALSFALAHRGDLDAATEHLREAISVARSIQCNFFVAYGEFCEAYVRYLRGEQALALQALETGFRLARMSGVIIPPYCPRETASLLCNLALHHDIHSDYVRTIIDRMRLSPPRDGASSRWPWPLRIYALGRFSVIKDNAPLSLDGRAHQKPLALLRAIAAHGERDVSMMELAQSLWPDSDGDMAAHALRTTLYRLRKLIGEECIDTCKGRLKLNAQHCWLDVRELDHLLEGDLAPSQTTVESFLALLRGRLLEGVDVSWVLSKRERLQEKVTRTLGHLSHQLEETGDYDAALKCALKGIEIVPQAEEFYRCAMRCYRELGKPAAAIALYERCRRFFASTLKLEPAAETRNLYDQISRNRSNGGIRLGANYAGTATEVLSAKGSEAHKQSPPVT